MIDGISQFHESRQQLFPFGRIAHAHVAECQVVVRARMIGLNRENPLEHIARLIHVSGVEGCDTKLQHDARDVLGIRTLQSLERLLCLGCHAQLVVSQIDDPQDVPGTRFTGQVLISHCHTVFVLAQIEIDPGEGRVDRHERGIYLPNLLQPRRSSRQIPRLDLGDGRVEDESGQLGVWADHYQLVQYGLFHLAVAEALV